MTRAGKPVDDDDSVVVLGKVSDRKGRRVAWVERCRPDGGDGWVHVWLKLAGTDVEDLPAVDRSRGPGHPAMPRPRVAIPLVTDREDRVTGVESMRFFTHPAAVCVVYRFGAELQLCRLMLEGPGLYGIQVRRITVGTSLTLISSEQSWLGDEVLCHLGGLDETAPLLYGMYLPELRPLVPIPAPAPTGRSNGRHVTLRPGGPQPNRVRWVESSGWKRGGAPQEIRGVDLRLPGGRQYGYLADPEVLWDRLRAALTGAGSADLPPDGPDILIGSVATPFWSEPELTEPSGRYQLSTYPRGPWWFPAAWYRYLRCPVEDGGAGRPEEAAVWLAWLGRLARGGSADRQPAGQAGGSTVGGWDPQWSQEDGITSFALIHLRRQAKVLASACRAGNVPLTGDVDLGRSWRRTVLAYPAGFTRAWRTLPGTFR